VIVKEKRATRVKNSESFRFFGSFRSRGSYNRAFYHETGYNVFNVFHNLQTFQLQLTRLKYFQNILLTSNCIFCNIAEI